MILREENNTHPKVWREVFWECCLLSKQWAYYTYSSESIITVAITTNAVGNITTVTTPVDLPPQLLWLVLLLLFILITIVIIIMIHIFMNIFYCYYYSYRCNICNNTPYEWKVAWLLLCVPVTSSNVNQHRESFQIIQCALEYSSVKRDSSATFAWSYRHFPISKQTNTRVTVTCHCHPA